jgi:hypothetical protein
MTNDEILGRILEGERAIYGLLSEFLTLQKQQNLGFCQSINSKIIYIGGDVGGWYFYENEKQNPIESQSIRFNLEKITIRETEYKGKTNLKLQIHVDCGTAKYRIQTGLETYFSKAILMAFLTAFEQKPAKSAAWGLSVQKGDENVVFPHLYLEDQYIFVPKDIVIQDIDPMNLLIKPEFSWVFDQADPHGSKGKQQKQPDKKPPIQSIDIQALSLESNDLIKRLGWTTEKAREYLARNFNKSSRLNLSDSEYLEFVAKLRRMVNENS